MIFDHKYLEKVVSYLTDGGLKRNELLKGQKNPALYLEENLTRNMEEEIKIHL